MLSRRTIVTGPPLCALPLNAEPAGAPATTNLKVQEADVLIQHASRTAMQPAPQSVCLNMQPYDAQGKEQDPTWYPPVRRLAVQEHRDHVLWSLFNFSFFNYFCCLGFAALVFSIKSRDRKVVGDPDGAASYGRTAKYLNITSTVLAVLFLIIFIVMISLHTS